MVGEECILLGHGYINNKFLEITAAGNSLTDRSVRIADVQAQLENSSLKFRFKFYPI